MDTLPCFAWKTWTVVVGAAAVVGCTPFGNEVDSVRGGGAGGSTSAETGQSGSSTGTSSSGVGGSACAPVDDGNPLHGRRLRPRGTDQQTRGARAPCTIGGTVCDGLGACGAPECAGTLGFAAAASSGVGAGPISVKAVDLNGDGRQDLVTANASSNNVSVLLAPCAP
ncbi:MAG: hypothetical protein ABJE95_20790 [Byssovorax sp.]